MKEGGKEVEAGEQWRNDGDQTECIIQQKKRGKRERDGVTIPSVIARLFVYRT